ncbi:hypothetical protein EDD17DRAFT_1892923 [Pisolithus thermaeus]|nr:hypothetical protein EDD17DRAFT_1892923 [Pisolithus thermaeus]
MQKGRLYLCTCHAVGCGEQSSQLEHDSQPVMGTWVSKPLYFQHKWLDNFCFADIPDLIVESFEGIQSLGNAPEHTLQPSSVGVGPQILQAPNDQSVPSTNHMVALEATVDELNHLLITINQWILSFSTCSPLAFSSPPTSQSLEFAARQAVDCLDARTPQLDSSSSLNDTILAHKSHMSNAYRTLCNSRSTTQTRYEISLLHSKVIGEHSMDLPELAEDGCNWQTYGSWVLKAISEDGLMGHLDGSETRPTTSKLLQEYGAGWTPRTNEERDVVTAWKTADNVWHQRAAMAHQFIIYGLPDSILMLCMHLDTPREAFAYLEHRYGQIPRPEIQKTVDEAVQQHDMPSEQYMTAECAQSTCDSNDGPENLPGGHEDLADSPNDCAETESGFLTPKTKVTDVQHVEPHLLVVEVGAMDSKWLDEGMDAPKAPDKGGQCTDEVTACRDLPEPRSEALEPADNISRQAGGHY